ncbi:PTS mannitol transporter subunit IICB [Actinotalea sp.]|uniref:PTS mannitol transporter subunit IICB n=1 Tax=Actinotalea sp. TaxID=1872145 RepID=UPI002C15A698|nr:PTS mannitol transporter subunit IICB [Actinotalea sp.]HRA50798.1 PTS mannitol transporter subunit IICB [Actinotalea sp.]
MSAVAATPPAPTRAKQTQVHIQRFGAFLTGMIMPNLPAFIAWGLITSLFIAVGWMPNEILGGFGNADLPGSWQGAATALALADDGTTFHQYLGLVGPMIVYLLPLLIANQGGRMVYGERGGVVASIATMGVIVGSTIPMFLGAMIVGPLAGWLMKKIDAIWDGKIKPGFEMLVNMYAAGILGMGLAIGAFFGVAPLVTQVSDWLGAGVQALADAHLLPLMSIIVEPAKVLFLNNAIGNGTLVPLGTQQAIDTGKSLLFLVEANPGPGFGMLLAFMFFGIGTARASAPGAIIIQFFGGIHEVYFPFVLMKPILITGLIVGGATGVATNAVFGSGLVAPAAPGSIFAVLAQTPRGSHIGVILSVLLSAAATFLISAVLLRLSRKRDLAAEDGLAAAIAQTEANKGKASSVLGTLATGSAHGVRQQGGPVHTIIFACDAGMGSSAMGASVLRSKLKKAGIEDVAVVNKAVAHLTDEAQIVITQRELTDRARHSAPSAEHRTVDNFMNSPVYDEVVAEVLARRSTEGASL